MLQPAGRAGELLDSIVNGIFTAGVRLQAAMGLPLPRPPRSVLPKLAAASW